MARPPITPFESTSIPRGVQRFCKGDEDGRHGAPVVGSLLTVPNSVSPRVSARDKPPSRGSTFALVIACTVTTSVERDNQVFVG